MAKPRAFSSAFNRGFGVGRYRYALVPWVWNAGGSGLNYWRLPDSAVGGVDLRNLSQQAMAGGAPQGFAFCATMQPVTGVEIAESLNLADEVVTTGMRDAWQSTMGFRPAGDKLGDLLWDQLTTGADPTGQSGPKPLMPSADNVLRLHLGGHSIVKSEPFQWGLHPHTNRVRDVLRENFRRVHESNQTQARKMLDKLCKKFRVDQWSEFVPADLRAHVPGRLKHDTTVTETFDQSDSTTLGPDLTWTEYRDTSATDQWETVSNQARVLAGGGNINSARAESDLSGDDHYAQASVTTLGSGSQNVQVGTSARFDAAAATFYGCRLIQIIDVYRAFKFNGSMTELGSDYSLAITLPHTVKIEADGSSITAYLDGVVRVGPVTDTAITGNLRAGIVGFTDGNTGELDSFEAADLSVGDGVSNIRVAS